MATTKTVYRLSNLDLNELNRAFQSISDRMDKQEGWRGTPEFQADIDLKSNKATNVATATADEDAVNLGQTTDSITTATGTVFAGIGFSQLFESAEQTITAGGLLTLAHGLDTEPILYECFIVNQTPEFGFIADDVTAVPHFSSSSSALDSQGVAILADDTNIYVQYGNAATTFRVIRIDTGGSANITNASWTFFVRAWA